jgi:hypothetical protein
VTNFTSSKSAINFRSSSLSTRNLQQVRKHLFQLMVAVRCVPIFIISTAKPLYTLNAQTHIDLQTPQQEDADDEDDEDEEDEEGREDLQPTASLPQPDQRPMHFLDHSPQTRAMFDHLTERTNSLSLDESSTQGIPPLQSATDGPLFISRQNGGGQTLAHIAASCGRKALYEDLRMWGIDSGVTDKYGCTPRDHVRFETDWHPPMRPGELSPREPWLIDREAWEALSQEKWYLNQEEEPLNHSGKSILVRWVNCLETVEGPCWRCRVPMKIEGWCPKTFTRIDRAIAHVRNHLGLKPYPCEGLCGQHNWYAGEPLPHNFLNNILTFCNRVTRYT